MKNIKELTLEELKTFFAQWEEPAFRAAQVFSWVYKRHADDFSMMSDLPAPLIARLKEHFCLSSVAVETVLASQDGTKKLLLRVAEGNYIEAVMIPTEKRATGCVSSQVGCKFACSFCASGRGGFKRQLSCGEILDEIALLEKEAPEKKLTHLVFMGMGEPLDNYDTVLKAIRIVNSSYGPTIGARRITVSTCGIIPGIERLAGEGLQIELSVSLHAADDKTRSALMPVNKQYPLAALMEACRNYYRQTKRQVTFEYVLIKGLNSDLQSARNLSTIIRGFDAKVNLIPCNDVPDAGYAPAERREVLAFKECLVNAGARVTVRTPRGQDIASACGQLRLRYEKI